MTKRVGLYCRVSTKDQNCERQLLELREVAKNHDWNIVGEYVDEGISGSNSVKVTLDGEGEMHKIEISDDVLKEEKSIIEDLIVAAHNNAKAQLKSKTTEEISKATGGLGIPGFKWPL